jgi:hypothetical protein
MPYPSIYSTIHAQDGRTGTLKFRTPHMFYSNNTILFNGDATFDGKEPIEVAIKLLYGQYGYDVHDYLASKGLAPQLYGKSTSQFQPPSGPTIVPTAIVMEDLAAPDPTSSKPGWIPLYTFLEDHKDLSAVEKTRIFEQIFKIIVLLREQQFVHGDLRSPNLMIKVKGMVPEYQVMVLDDDGQSPQIMVVDFDWAGRAGQVKYPRSRNVTAPWAGKAGGVISLDDDWILLKNWWFQKFPEFDFSSYIVPSPAI